MRKRAIMIMVILLAFHAAGCGEKQKDPGENAGSLGFHEGNTSIMIYAEAESVLAALGDPRGYTEEPSCASSGMDKTYDYGKFFIRTFPTEEGDRIMSIWFTAPGVMTDEGIRIGSTQTEAEAAYGQHYEQENTIRLQQEHAVMRIILTDGVVTSIQYDAVIS